MPVLLLTTEMRSENAITIGETVGEAGGINRGIPFIMPGQFDLPAEMPDLSGIIIASIFAMQRASLNKESERLAEAQRQINATIAHLTAQLESPDANKVLTVVVKGFSSELVGIQAAMEAMPNRHSALNYLEQLLLFVCNSSISITIEHPKL